MRLRNFLPAISLALSTLFVAPASGTFAATAPNAPSGEARPDQAVVSRSDAAPVDVSALVNLLAADPSIQTCWTTGTWFISGFDIFGLELWRYNKSQDWCDDDFGTITVTFTPTITGQTFFLGWNYLGSAFAGGSGGVGFSWYDRTDQGHFQFCPIIACIQDSFPFIDMTVNAGGLYTVSGG